MEGEKGEFWETDQRRRVGGEQRLKGWGTEERGMAGGRHWRIVGSKLEGW